MNHSPFFPCAGGRALHAPTRRGFLYSLGASLGSVAFSALLAEEAKNIEELHIHPTLLKDSPQQTAVALSLLKEQLAHGYHYRVVGNKNPEVLSSFQKAKAGGAYNQVKRWTGERLVPDKTYAMTNPQEYFAEKTEAFFGKNDFEPFEPFERQSSNAWIPKCMPCSPICGGRTRSRGTARRRSAIAESRRS